MGSGIEYAIFGSLMAANLGLGLYFSVFKKTRERSSSEVFLGSRTLASIPLAMSAIASLISTMGIVGLGAHFYAFGFHYDWSLLATVVVLPVVVYVIVPTLYQLKVTSVFEYLRLRFGNTVGILMSLIHFFLSGGFRGVVWTDSVQCIIMLLAPLTVIVKVVYDSNTADVSLRPLSSVPIQDYIFKTRFDLSSDENVWSCAVPLTVYALFRQGVDQVSIQRYMAAASLQQAQRTAVFGAIFFILYNIVLSGMGMALIYWFRGCDPLLSGSISRIDQIVPYYVKTYLAGFLGFPGFFLAGAVSAATSTVSSLINSQAAVFYIDVISVLYTKSDRLTARTTTSLAFFFGIIMTLYSLIIPLFGSALQVVMVSFSAASGPFVGVMLLALVFPWGNGQGALSGAFVTLSIQMWQVIGRYTLDIRHPRMPATIEYCPNSSLVSAYLGSNSSTTNAMEEDLLFIYRISSYWWLFFSMMLTVIIGNIASLLTGGSSDTLHLTSSLCVKFWKKLKIIPQSEKVFQVAQQGETEL
ncbi:sodium-coupled monocarboxylate transporter 2-like [Ixodes scapularis]